MIDQEMDSPRAAPALAPARSLRRASDNRLLGGVCAGLAGRLGVDPLLVRVGFIAAATAGGVGLAIYALAWALVPADHAGAAPAGGARTGRAGVEVALGAALLLLSALLVLRGVGLWFSDAVVWPLVLVAAGGALLWRQSTSTPRPAIEPSGWAGPPSPESSSSADVSDAVTGGHGEDARDLPARAALVSRVGLGAALVMAAGLAFLQATGSLSAARDVVLAALVVAVVLGIIFAPWIIRLARSLAAERAERIRSQERAEMAAHLHDSVLQTLALVQKNAAQPRAVASLARRQERELRSWLSGRRAEPSRRLVALLEAAAADVEHAQSVEVEVVAVGDCALDARGEALVAAAREAMVNAAKFARDSPIDVYAEASADRVVVFVRDRGPGFDVEDMPEDRQGVRESIIGRMVRHGGRAAIHSEPAGGTEVELTLERDKP